MGIFALTNLPQSYFLYRFSLEQLHFISLIDLTIMNGSGRAFSPGTQLLLISLWLLGVFWEQCWVMPCTSTYLLRYVISFHHIASNVIKSTLFPCILQMLLRGIIFLLICSCLTLLDLPDWVLIAFCIAFGLGIIGFILASVFYRRQGLASSPDSSMLALEDERSASPCLSQLTRRERGTYMTIPAISETTR